MDIKSLVANLINKLDIDLEIKKYWINEIPRLNGEQLAKIYKALTAKKRGMLEMLEKEEIEYQKWLKLKIKNIPKILSDILHNFEEESEKNEDIDKILEDKLTAI